MILFDGRLNLNIGMNTLLRLLVGIGLVSCFFSFGLAAFAQERRIVSLSPATTEWVVALGLQTQLKGVTEQCDTPAAVKSLQKVGSFMRMSLERVLALHPTDVVVVDGFPEAQRRQLVSSGARVHAFQPSRLKDFPEQIRLLGKALGVEEAANRLSSEFQNRLLQFEKNKNLARPKALFFVSFEPVYLVGSSTWLSDVFHLAGFENAFVQKRSSDAFPKVSPESLMGFSSRYWFGFYEHESQKAVMKEKLNSLRGKWHEKEERSPMVEVFPSSLFLRPGPRLWEALGELRKFPK